MRKPVDVSEIKVAVAGGAFSAAAEQARSLVLVPTPVLEAWLRQADLSNIETNDAFERAALDAYYGVGKWH